MTTTFRPPSTTTATIDDFRRGDWNTDAQGERSYFVLWDSLSKKGFAATEAKELGKAKVLWLLADACSFRFEASNINEPFVSTQLDEFGRPYNLDSFTDKDLALFAEIYPEIDDSLLRARVADIVWLCSRPKRDRHAALRLTKRQSGKPRQSCARPRSVGRSECVGRLSMGALSRGRRPLGTLTMTRRKQRQRFALI